MTPVEALAVLAAGVGAGTVNTIVGSGTLITFPVLLAVGYPPVVANVTNTVGLTPGSASGAFGYRAELSGQGRRLRTLGVVSGIGGITGALLLLTLPSEAFETIVPILIGVACVLVVVQPWLAARLSRPHEAAPQGGIPLHVGVFGSGVYGGYFGAAQGVLLIALMGVFLNDSLQRINAAKNVLAGLVNGVAAVVFIIAAEVAWAPAALIAVGSVLGGVIGARIGRRVPGAVLRALVVLVGVVAITRLLWD